MELSGAETVFGALDRVGARYLVVGGLAVNAHGYVRLTMDIDLVIGLRQENLVKALRALSEAGYRIAAPVTPEQFAVESNRERWRAEKGMRVLKLWSDAFRLTPVDVFVYEPFDFDAEHARAVNVELRKGLRVPVVCLETLLAMKRAAGRPQDLADVAALESLAQNEA